MTYSKKRLTLHYPNGNRDGVRGVVTIYALVEHAHVQGKTMEFIWNADKGPQPYCSDFPGSRSRCND